MQLTDRQTEALDFIKGFIRQNNYPPSLQDIAEGIGVGSRSQAHAVVTQLENKGKITRARYRARSIQVK